MIWRSVRLSLSLSLPRPRLPPGRCYSPPRHHSHSSLTSSDLNIATILASPPTKDGHRITAIGSVRTLRTQKRHAFVELGDGSTPHSLQAILNPSQAEGLTTGATVAISGSWQPAPETAEQSFELHAGQVTVIGGADETYPIQKKYHSAEYFRAIPHLRLRTPLNAVLARIRSDCDYHLTKFFREQSFVRVQTPISTSSDCEGAGEVFSISTQPSPPPNQEEGHGGSSKPFFRSSKFLTVSSQLHLEAFVHEHQKVWTLSPTFRAEKSDTPRHVSEFWMLEAEVRTEDLQDIMNIVKQMIQALVNGLRDSGLVEEFIIARRKASGEEAGASFPWARWDNLSQRSWPQVTYEHAMRQLQEAVRCQRAAFQHEPTWDNGLQLEHEKYIVAEIGQGAPVFVTHYPRKLKPFYMLPSANRHDIDHVSDDTADCFDLLVPETCEIVGGSLREHRLGPLMQAMHDHRLSVSTSTPDLPEGSPAPADSNLDWYLDLRRYGTVPHGGFGLGLDRLLCHLVGINNIKDVVPWPRYHGRCDC